MSSPNDKRVTIIKGTLEIQILSMKEQKSKTPLIKGKGSPPIASSNFLQFLARIITCDTYLILCGFHEYFKTVGFF
jgi:hypothetical protein